MPVIRVSCLPRMEEEQLNLLHKNIVLAVVSVRELGLKNEAQMTCLFPPDTMAYGLGEEIVIEVFGLIKKPERTLKVQQVLAWRLVASVESFFPNALIECFVNTFDPETQGFYQNRPPVLRVPNAT